MNVEIENGNACRRVMRVSATPDEARQDTKAVMDEYRQTSVPGFRKGKAPLTVIETRYRKEIGDAVGKRAASRLFREALDERGRECVGPARFTAIAFDGSSGVTFTVEFDEAPAIGLPDFKSFTPSPKAADDAGRKDELSEYLLNHTTVALPESLVEQELELAARGPQGPRDEKRLADAERRVKLLLILQQIAKTEGIEIDEKDIEERIAVMAEASGASARSLRTELEQKNGIERLSLFLLAEQTMDYILGDEG